jgi:hypothetical protein
LNRFFAQRYNRQGLWTLFLMCAFPLHVWALILSFRDLSWLTERTNAIDAIGVMSYAVVLALVESLLLFGVITLLGLLVPARWSVERRVALLAVLALLLSLWAMAAQLFFLLGVSPSEQTLAWLARSGHPVRIMYLIALLLVTASFLTPALLMLRSERVHPAVSALIDRLSLLTTVYLVFDAAGLLIVIIRNLS